MWPLAARSTATSAFTHRRMRSRLRRTMRRATATLSTSGTSADAGLRQHAAQGTIGTFGADSLGLMLAVDDVTAPSKPAVALAESLNTPNQ